MKQLHLKPSNVFIVGVGRSGTKFLQSVLSAHPELNISTETQFFSKALHNGFIKVADKIGSMREDKNVNTLVDAMFTRKDIFGPFWKNQILKNKEVVLQRFLQSDRSYKSFYGIIIDEDRIQKNKSISGEKTPSHLYHVDTLLMWFPQAKIIQIIRDPKKVLASEMHKKLKPDHPLKKGSILYNLSLLFYVLINWNNSIKLDKKYKQKYPENYTSVRYEDLLKDHENTVKKICKFLNLEFNTNMLNPPVRGSSFSELKIHDKQEKKVQLPKLYISTINLLLGKKLKQYNYQT
jgi:omega-hydroxy-beta-dihydromenaquinone-9 sulfotransferase